jgi:hypothetical protein
MIFIGIRRTLPLAFVVVLVLGASSRAERFADWAFDPPAGSRWTLASVETAEEVRAARTQTTTVKTLSELSYDEKTADGYRITFVLRSVESTGTLVEAMDASAKPLENIVIHAMLNRNGLPVRIENADDVQAAVNSGIERILEPLRDKPQMAAALRRAFEGRLNVRDPQGAGRVLAPLSLLALGQNTGLHAGETKYGSEEFASPFGGEPLKGATELHMESADLASGNVRLIYTRAPNKDSMREFTNRITNQLAAAAGLQQWDSTKLKHLDIAFESRTELEVGEGITRAVHREETTNIALPGNRLLKRQRIDVKVTQVP